MYLNTIQIQIITIQNESIVAFNLCLFALRSSIYLKADKMNFSRYTSLKCTAFSLRKTD